MATKGISYNRGIDKPRKKNTWREPTKYFCGLCSSEMTNRRDNFYTCNNEKCEYHKGYLDPTSSGYIY